ncbi:MAG: response regulator [Planctomycetes bacterium]|nr:response regulator [Planctomycetota bacterium]
MVERVVIVDDEEGILALLRRVLRAAGREIEIFPSPLHALPAIRRHRPDVVVTDLHMPGMSGPEFVRTLRAEFGDRIGIIVITAFPALVADADAVAHGVGAYLRKPFTDLELLRSTVAEVIEAARRRPLVGADAETVRDLAAARAAELKRRASLSRADVVLQAIADGIVLLDRDGRVQQLNPAAADLLDVRAEECLGRELAELKLDPKLRATLLAPPGPDPRTPRRERIELARRGRVVDVRTVPLVGAEGGPAGSFAVLADATAELRVQELKHHYLNVVAHELRTPLTALNSFAACLGRGAPPLDPRQREVIAAMEGQLLRLERQIDKLLLLAELERGSAAIREPFLLAPIVEEAVAPCRLAAAEKGVAFALAAVDAQLQVLGNADDLRRALAEVAENAVKFTPAGGSVAIAVEARADEAVVEVRDSGIGIAPEHHETIFLGFRQLEAPLTRAHEGAGLGLSLARRMVEASGGTIALASAPASGSTFTLRLPTAAAARRSEASVAVVQG